MKDQGLKSVEKRFEEEHSLWECVFVNSQGAPHVINWELASAPEYRQMMAKYKQIEQYMQPPYFIEAIKKESASSAKEEELSDAERADQEKAEQKSPKTSKRKAEAETVEKQTVRELFDYVLNEGRKEYTVQRYKGLGEMSSQQLWETTMDPERRTLLSSEARGPDRDRNHLHHADGRRRRSAPQVHRRQRAGREEPRYLVSRKRLSFPCSRPSSGANMGSNQLQSGFRFRRKRRFTRTRACLLPGYSPNSAFPRLQR